MTWLRLALVNTSDTERSLPFAVRDVIGEKHVPDCRVAGWSRVEGQMTGRQTPTTTASQGGACESTRSTTHASGTAS